MGFQTTAILLLSCSLQKLETRPGAPVADRIMEFHVHSSIRSLLGMDSSLFRTTGNLIIADFSAARSFADKLRSKSSIGGQDTSRLSAGKLNAMGLIDEILHLVMRIYREKASKEILSALALRASKEVGGREYARLLGEFAREFPSSDVYRGTSSAEDWLASVDGGRGGQDPQRRTRPRGTHPPQAGERESRLRALPFPLRRRRTRDGGRPQAL